VKISNIKYKSICALAYIKELIRINRTRTGVWLSLGDSLSKTGMYQTLVNDNFRMEIVNDSVGGTTMADNGDRNSMSVRFTSTLPDNVKLITIMCGTNDFSQNIKIGTIDDEDQYTFCGALNYVVDLYKQRYPLAKIILISPPKRRHKNNQLENLNGDTIEDFALVIDKIAKVHGVGFVDVCNGTNITIDNLHNYTIDNVHLNIKGYQEIAKLIKNKLEVS
jgi:lysophospholipase L1-like esterase